MRLGVTNIRLLYLAVSRRVLVNAGARKLTQGAIICMNHRMREASRSDNVGVISIEGAIGLLPAACLK